MDMENFIIEHIRKQALPFRTDKDLDQLVEAVGDARIVLLGEASHGTSEFYSIRAELTKRLIEQKGFSFIAVEGDWPSCYSLNQYIKNVSSTTKRLDEVMQDFNRWPTWMWANQEIMALASWLREWNDAQPTPRSKIGFYGLDVYSLWESMEAIIQYLDKQGSPAEEIAMAKRAFACFEPHHRDAQKYGVHAAFLADGCEDEVVQLLTKLRSRYQHTDPPTYLDPATEGYLSAEINGMVMVDAERYYRAMVQGGPDSWNIRDEHMVAVLNRLMAFHGQEAKAIVWEHNTHVGDARATDMVDDGMVNVGQLVREQHGEKAVFAIGFGTHRGTVIAADDWGESMQEKTVPAAIRDSWEDLMHQAAPDDQILIFHDHPAFQHTVGHRAIGVIYHPRYERGNYVPTNMAKRYDGFIYIDETHALRPLTVHHVNTGV